MPENPPLMAIPGAAEPPEGAVIQHVREMALAMNTRVLLFGSVDNGNHEKDVHDPGQEQGKAATTAIEQARSQLSRCAGVLRESGLQVDISLNWKMPYQLAVAQVIQRTQPEFIICERTPLSLMDKLGRKDPDWQLTQLTDIPIIYVDRLTDRKPTNTIWAAVDPMHAQEDHSRLNDCIIEKAKRLATISHSELHLVHCFSSAKKLAEIAIGLASAEHLPAEDIQRDIRNQHYVALEELAKRHGLDHDRVHNLPGIAPIMLPVLAERRRPDLIVAGATRHGWVAQILHGSTARKLLHRLTGALCIVGLPDYANTPENTATLDVLPTTQTGIKK